MDARNLIGGFIAVAAMGVVAGLLLAPSSGKKARKQLVKDSLKLKDGVADYVDESIDAFRNQLNEKIDQLARRGRETINHVSEKVKL